MKNFQIPVPKYPWPRVASPFEDNFDREEVVWLDTDYTFLSAAAQNKYKHHNLARAAAFALPTITDYERLRPASRFLVWGTVFDDYYELCPLNEFTPIRDRMVSVLTSEEPRPDENGLFRQAAQFRKELLAYTSNVLLERVVDDYYRYITYGLMEETPYRTAGLKCYPSLACVMSIREYSLGVYPFFHMIDLAINTILPSHIYIHPVIQRLKTLVCNILAFQNDFASIARDAVRETEVMNAVLALQNERKSSLAEACTEAMKLHDAYVGEVAALHAELPDFGEHQETVENYVYHMELMVTGLSEYYYNKNTRRYIAHEYPEPEYIRQSA